MNDNPSEANRAQDPSGKTITRTFGGIDGRSDGIVRHTVEGMIGGKIRHRAGDERLSRSTGTAFHPTSGTTRLWRPKPADRQLRLIVRKHGYFRVISLIITAAKSFRHLVRDDSKPDLLTEIYRAKVSWLSMLRFNELCGG